MVGGIEMVFSKEKMIARLKKEGRFEGLPNEVFDIMNNLDNQPVGTNSWNRQVMGEPDTTAEMSIEVAVFLSAVVPWQG